MVKKIFFIVTIMITLSGCFAPLKKVDESIITKLQKRKSADKISAKELKELAMALFEKNSLWIHLNKNSKEDEEALKDYKFRDVDFEDSQMTEISSDSVDCIMVIRFDVEPVDGSIAWTAGTGVDGKKGWIEDKAVRVHLYKVGNEFKLDSMGFG